jgi:hypothetical protein
VQTAKDVGLVGKDPHRQAASAAGRLDAAWSADASTDGGRKPMVAQAPATATRERTNTVITVAAVLKLLSATPPANEPNAMPRLMAEAGRLRSTLRALRGLRGEGDLAGVPENWVTVAS